MVGAQQIFTLSVTLSLAFCKMSFGASQLTQQVVTIIRCGTQGDTQRANLLRGVGHSLSNLQLVRRYTKLDDSPAYLEVVVTNSDCAASPACAESIVAPGASPPAFGNTLRQIQERFPGNGSRNRLGIIYCSTSGAPLKCVEWEPINRN